MQKNTLKRSKNSLEPKIDAMQKMTTVLPTTPLSKMHINDFSINQCSFDCKLFDHHLSFQYAYSVCKNHTKFYSKSVIFQSTFQEFFLSFFEIVLKVNMRHFCPLLVTVQWPWKEQPLSGVGDLNQGKEQSSFSKHQRTKSFVEHLFKHFFFLWLICLGKQSGKFLMMMVISSHVMETDMVCYFRRGGPYIHSSTESAAMDKCIPA